MGALGLTFTPCFGAQQGLGQFSPLPQGNVSQGALSALQAQGQWRVGRPLEALGGTATRLRTLAVGSSQLQRGGLGVKSWWGGGVLGGRGHWKCS